MSTDNSIFSDASPATPVPNGAATPNTSNNDALDTILQSIKNDRGEPKYKSVEDALVALRHSQEYIPLLNSKLTERERELEELHKQKNSQAELESLVERLTQSNQAPNTNAGAIDESKIAELVEQKLQASRQAQTATENRNMVETALRQKFGDEKIAEVLQHKAQEMGLSKQEIADLAARSPKAVLTMFGVSEDGVQRQPRTPPTESSVRTEAFSGQVPVLIGRETYQLPLGATDQEVRVLQQNANKMVEELHKQGMSVEDLTDPKVFFKIMK